jgi:hypothetical protein
LRSRKKRRWRVGSKRFRATLQVSVEGTGGPRAIGLEAGTMKALARLIDEKVCEILDNGLTVGDDERPFTRTIIYPPHRVRSITVDTVDTKDAEGSEDA